MADLALLASLGLAALLVNDVDRQMSGRRSVPIRHSSSHGEGATSDKGSDG
jgi:hypothetical protein